MKLESVSPILSVNDLTQSLDFYWYVLGFDLAWSWGSRLTLPLCVATALKSPSRNGQGPSLSEQHMSIGNELYVGQANVDTGESE